MKFITERDVPEKIRLMQPLKKEPVAKKEPDPLARLPEILQALLDVAKQGREVQATIDTTPIADAIRALPQPAVSPPVNEVKSWTFTLKRDTYGVLTEVIATKLT